MRFPLYFPITFSEAVSSKGGTYSLIVDEESMGELYEPYIEMELNQIWFVECELTNLSATQLNALKKNNSATVYYDETPILHGVLRSITKDEDGAAYLVRVESPAVLLTDKINYDATATDGRKEWTDERGDVIIRELLAGRMEEGQIDEMPYIGFRAEYDTPLEAISGVCKVCGKDWWISNETTVGDYILMGTIEKMVNVYNDPSVPVTPDTTVNSTKIYSTTESFAIYTPEIIDILECAGYYITVDIDGVRHTTVIGHTENLNRLTTPANTYFLPEIPIGQEYGNGCTFWIHEQPKMIASISKFNAGNKGSSTPIQTFTMGQDIDRAEAEDTVNSIYNKIYCFGYGDGRNQLRAVWEHSTLVRTFLTADITSTDTTIYVENTGLFLVGNSIMIGREVCSITGIPNATTLTVTRGVNSDEIKPYPHKAGIEVYSAVFNSDNPQTGSSIDITNGPIENRYVDKSIIDQNTLDLLAQRLGHKYKNESVQGKFVCYADATTASVGDVVTIVDYDGNQSDYRVTKWKFDPEEFAIVMEYSTIGSEPLTTIELGRNIDINNPYGQGSTCINQIQSYENCSSSYPLHVRFRIPDDVVAINKVLLSFRIEDYRTYHKETTGHAHNVQIPITHKDDSNVGTNNVYITGTFSLIDTQRFINGRTGLGSVYSESIASSSNSATTYTIDTVNVASPSVSVYAGVNGSETLVGTYTDDQDEIDIVANVSEPGAWYNVKFVPAAGQHLRIEANVYLKVFVRSN